MEEWLKTHDTSPTTGRKLEYKDLTPNRVLKDLIGAINEDKSFGEIGALLSNDPLTLDTPENPVVATDGYTYDRSAIKKVLEKHKPVL
jgi:hypothetical protein